jgi:hypothetical protein
MLTPILLATCAACLLLLLLLLLLPLLQAASAGLLFLAFANGAVCVGLAVRHTKRARDKAAKRSAPAVAQETARCASGPKRHPSALARFILFSLLIFSPHVRSPQVCAVAH